MALFSLAENRNGSIRLRGAMSSSRRKAALPRSLHLSFESRTPQSLPESDRIRVCERDGDNSPGIIAALKFRNATGLKQDVPLINRPILARAMGEAGIRRSQRHRRVGDYELKELLAEGPDNANVQIALRCASFCW
jgi:hypothetical protein